MRDGCYGLARLRSRLERAQMGLIHRAVLVLALARVTHAETSTEACIDNGLFDPNYVTCACRPCSWGRWGGSQSYDDCPCS